MIIYKSIKMIYIHLHKNAGTSIERSFASHQKPGDLLLENGDIGTNMKCEFGQDVYLDKHSSAAAVLSAVGERIWGEYYTWTTIRSPYARVVSLYCAAASMAEPNLGKVEFPFSGDQAAQRAWLQTAPSMQTPPWSYPAVVAYLYARSAPHPFSEFLRATVLNEKEPAFVPQVKRLSSASGGILLKRVVRAEELTAAWPLILSDLKIPPIPLVTANETPTQWRQPIEKLLYRRDDIDYVNHRFRDDFRIFDYEMI